MGTGPGALEADLVPYSLLGPVLLASAMLLTRLSFSRSSSGDFSPAVGTLLVFAVRRAPGVMVDPGALAAAAVFLGLFGGSALEFFRALAGGLWYEER